MNSIILNKISLSKGGSKWRRTFKFSSQAAGFYMRQKQFLLMTLVFLACGVLLGCGTTGKSSRFVLTLEPNKIEQIFSQIRIAPAAMEKDAARFMAVRVYAWGEFDTADLSNIEQSLRNTLASLTPALPQPTSRLDIHMMIRRYFVSTSNTGAAILVCVAWAATNSKGEMSYHEQFYASKAGYLIGTIGLLKDSVHRAIVRRIATTSMRLAFGRGDGNFQQTTLENTYNSFEEAVSHLPPIMVSMGIIPGPPPGLLIPPKVSRVFWDEAKPSEEFNWNEYLRDLYKSE